MNKIKALLTDRRLLIVFLLGFSSGLPLLLTGGTLQAWCRQSGLELKTIGLFAFVSIPYTLKFLWSPILDRFVPPFLGRRRGWLLIAQLGLVVTLLALGFGDPKIDPITLVIVAFLVSFMSATQDIAVDAFQIETLPRETYGLGNQIYVLGYRIGMLLAGSGSLILADVVSWQMVYTIMAGCMVIGILTTLFAKEPVSEARPPRSLVESVWHPLVDFFSPQGSQKGRALWIIAFILLYKLGGDMATALSTPFYLDLKYTTSDIGKIAKTFGLTATIVGGIIGGTFVVYLGVRRSLWIFGIIQGLANLSFAWLTYHVTSGAGPSVAALATAISIENLAAGLGTAAYTTFMGTLVNRRFTATQYALLSSLMATTRIFAAPLSGVIAQDYGWMNLFYASTIASFPGLFILFKLKDVSMPDSPPALITEDAHPAPVAPAKGKV